MKLVSRLPDMCYGITFGSSILLMKSSGYIYIAETGGFYGFNRYDQQDENEL